MWEDIIADVQRGLENYNTTPLDTERILVRVSCLLADAEALLPALHELIESGAHEEWENASIDGRTVKTFEEWLEAFYPQVYALPAHLREQGEG